MHRRTSGGFVLLVLVVTVALPTAAGAIGELPATVVPVSPPVSQETYDSVDYGRKSAANDDRRATTSWRIVEGTGNCCETFVTTTPTGRLLDFGGSYIHFSDDRGQTWSRLEPLAPLVNGEGAIVAAPGGDVLGVEWDPYSGDHLQFYKYEADTRQWQYTEMPLHQPFYDREWIAVVPGPVTIGGQTYEYVALVKGGVPKDVFFYSTDGLNYAQVTSSDLDGLLGDDVVGPLPTTADPINDWAQANTNGAMTAIGGGGALAAPDTLGSWSLLDGGTFTWSAYAFPNDVTPSGRFQVDSTGRIHNLVFASDSGSFDYRISADGGATWKTTTVALPTDHVVEEYDFRANAAAGVAAVAIRAANNAAGNDQDLVYKLDITGPGARLLRLYEVGLGDVDATGGVGNDIRFDFGSVTVFADGRVAVSFLDSTTTGRSPTTGAERLSPAIAIELDTKLGQKVRTEEPVPPVLGEPYAAYSFDAGDEGWSGLGGVGAWLRSPPGMTAGQDNLFTQSFGIEGPLYADNLNATLTSPSIVTVAGRTVIEFWTKMDVEEGFDYLRLEWSADGATWRPFSRLTGRNAGYPAWDKVTLGFDSPGGPIRVRFRFTSDMLCSGVDPACGTLFGGVRVDDVVVGRQG